MNGDLRFDGNESNFGDENDKIVGGTDTTIERHPHQLSLRLFSHTCGGSIISPVRGLTAVSCIIKTAEPKNYVIYAGSTTVSGDDNTQRRVLSGFVKHPAYDEEKHLNNIAILFWEQPLTIGANVRPIRLPAANAAVPYGQKATTTGWGRTYKEEGLLPEILKEVSLPLIRNEDCNRFYSGKITPDMVCAGGEADRGSIAMKNEFMSLIDIFSHRKIFSINFSM